LSFDLSAFFIKLARTEAYFSLQQVHHQLSTLVISGYAIHFSIPHNSSCLQLL
jgi:hypothetical protein